MCSSVINVEPPRTSTSATISRFLKAKRIEEILFCETVMIMYRSSYEGFPRDYWTYLHTPSDEAYGVVNDASTEAVQSIAVPAEPCYNYLYNQPVDPRLAGNLGGPWGGRSSFAGPRSASSITPPVSVIGAASSDPSSGASVASSNPSAGARSAFYPSIVGLTSEVAFDIPDDDRPEVDIPYEIPDHPEETPNEAHLQLIAVNSIARGDSQTAVAAIQELSNIAPMKPPSAVASAPAAAKRPSAVALPPTKPLAPAIAKAFNTNNKTKQGYSVRKVPSKMHPSDVNYEARLLKEKFDTEEAAINALERRRQQGRHNAEADLTEVSNWRDPNSHVWK